MLYFVLMNDRPTYQRIAASIKDDILSGKIQPGMRLPGVRELSVKWNCTPGTIQKSYGQLVQSGLVTSQPGKGTFVIGGVEKLQPEYTSLRKATLVLRAEQFFLENITDGFSLEDLAESFHLAADHWRSFEKIPEIISPATIRFSGSNDFVINALPELIDSIIPGTRMEIQTIGSIAGLFAISQDKADLTGCHLWDEGNGEYNLPYIYKLLPVKQVRVVTLAHRRIGFMTAPGNPLQIHKLADLTRKGVRFINRQHGSGTRVWLDSQISRNKINPETISGYDVEKNCHSEVAMSIALGQADVGIGLQSVAVTLGLDFVMLARERYDLVALSSKATSDPILSLLLWLDSRAGREFVGRFSGYEADHTGEVII
jgi:putative molybdopterin biosynthesis protein